MQQNDNGAALLAVQGTRADARMEWRLAVWQARQAAHRLTVCGDWHELRRLESIMAGALEGVPPARLEPCSIAHESRGLRSFSMHKGGAGMVAGPARHRRGSLDPAGVWDTIRGQGLPQTRTDYRADYTIAARLRPAALPNQSADWQAAAAAAARALTVWQRYILRLPSGMQPEEREKQGKARKPAILRHLRGLRPLRKAQARALRAVLERGGHRPASLLQDAARANCAPCACPACAEQAARARARAAEYSAEEDGPYTLQAPAPESDSAPWLDWQLRSARLQRAARLQRSACASPAQSERSYQTASPAALPALRDAQPRAVVAAACGLPALQPMRLAARKCGRCGRPFRPCACPRT